MSENDADPRSLLEGLCRVTVVGSTGIEWICIKKVHDPTYERHTRSFRHHEEIEGSGAHPERHFGIQAAPADRHYFVNRWPYRSKETT